MDIPHVYNDHDKTFFYFDLETSRGSLEQNLINPTVPLAAWRIGDFSALLPGTVVKNPDSGAAYPGNRIPINQLNPVSLALQNLFYPAPNNGSTTSLSSKNFVTTLIIRTLGSTLEDDRMPWRALVHHGFATTPMSN